MEFFEDVYLLPDVPEVQEVPEVAGEGTYLEDWPEEVDIGRRPRETSDQEESDKKKKQKKEIEAGDSENELYEALQYVNIPEEPNEEERQKLMLEKQYEIQVAKEKEKVEQKKVEKRRAEKTEPDQEIQPCDNLPDDPFTINFPIPVYYLSSIEDGYENLCAKRRFV